MKQIFKRVLSIIMVVVICLSLASCNSSCSDKEEGKKKENTSSKETASSDKGNETPDTDLPVSNGEDEFDLGLGDDFDLDINVKPDTNIDSGVEEEEVKSTVTYYAPNKKVDVNSANIVNNCFEGVGGNIVPSMWMTSNTSLGYNQAYFAQEVQRMSKMKVKIARLWVQEDWFETEKGVYNFDTNQMYAVCKWLDGFKQAGAMVQVTFGWKIGTGIQSWQSIPGISDPRCSAPADLDAYAKACSAFLQYVWGKGYDNVKYLTFANEPNGSWDWECYGDQCAYYISMVDKVDKQLKKDGIRNKIQLWACEEAGSLTWTKRVHAALPGVLDAASIHEYAVTSDSFVSWVKGAYEGGAQRYYQTEFSTSHNTSDDPRLHMASNFERGFTGLVLNGTKVGLTGLLNWCISGVEDMGGWTMTEETFFWHSMLSGGMPNNSYYECGLLTAYIDFGAKVVETKADGGDDIRSGVFVNNDGTQTIVVELDNSQENRSVTFNGVANGSYTKHVYTNYVDVNQNATLPPAVGTFNATNGSFVDTDIPKTYCVIVYTQKPSVKQIELNQARVEIKAGETFQFTSNLVDCSGSVEWAMEYGGGSITKDGLYTAPAGVASGDAIAVRVSLKSDPSVYSIGLIIIK